MGKINIDASLFEEEEAALRTASSHAESERYGGNELLPHYLSLLNEYRKLLRATKKVFYISDTQGYELQRHHSEIQNLLDNANQGFLTFGPDLKVDRRYSAECIRIFGRKIDNLSIAALLQQDGTSAEWLSEKFARLFTCLPGQDQWELQQIPAVFKIRGQDIRVECKLITQSPEADETTVVMMILTDITERLQAEKKIHFLSYHDKLTLLHNRAYVEERLPELEESAWLPMSIMIIDMNGLKLINDVFGHQQGDKQLVALAGVLRKCCRPGDIIARWGGDEFMILLPKTGQEVCSTICAHIKAACETVSDCAIPLSAAIGSATKEAGGSGLAEMFSAAENMMYNDKLARGREVRQSILSKLEGTLHERCFENQGHNERVLQLASEFITFLGLDVNSAEFSPLQRLAMLHDIGKVAIPREILGKIGPLSANDWEIVKSHSEIGYRLAQTIGEPAVADSILALHERWDGRGYPHGLRGTQIPFISRIFSLVDVFDVLTNERPYKKAMDKQAALREIEAGMGLSFDPELAACFIQYITECSEHNCTK